MDRARNKLTRQNFGDVSSRVSIVSLAVSLLCGCVGELQQMSVCVSMVSLAASLWCL